MRRVQKEVIETVMEDEEYSYRDVKLPSLIPIVSQYNITGLERETGERRRGRDIVIAIDHGPNSKYAFQWAIIHLCRMADTIHLVHGISSLSNEVVYDMTEALMDKLAVEAFQVAMVKTVARIIEGYPGRVICKEAERVKPAAVVVGTKGKGFIQSVLEGSVSEYCLKHCKVSPVVLVPGKEAGDEALI